ncbi:uncharacterized protein LOC135839882 [Planococcus citri]|uniref:uncharacterized protein LOC135839882 n=1 Tax=Planococcus citri TaxID=170843 RepID=UPI0031F7F19A
MLLRWFRRHLKPEIYGPGYKGFFNQAWRETPVYLFSVSMTMMSLIIVPIAMKKWKEMEGEKRRFMLQYTIMRPSDPNKNMYFYIDVTDKNNIIDPARKTYYDM